MSASVWRIGQVLNSVQSSFIGLLRVWSIPIVLLLSVASGYTTYYGMSFFITWWIALIITVAVQSIVVICTLELAGIHWRANLPRFLSILGSLLIALLVSISFSYFKFYEISQRDNTLMSRHGTLTADLENYLENLVKLRSQLMGGQEARTRAAGQEAGQAYLGAHPAMQGKFQNQVGKGPFWSHYNEIHQQEKAKLESLERQLTDLDQHIAQLRRSMQAFSFNLADASAYEKLVTNLQDVQGLSDALLSNQGFLPVKGPVMKSFAEFNRGITPSFAMWEDISWFALACAAMVDLFTVILSYRLEFTAPGPLSEEESELAYQGLRQFGEFTINHNDELEFVFEKSELERARRVPDWTRMFAVAFLLNRGYLRKVSERAVEFAPNLYPILAERLKLNRDDMSGHRVPANDDNLRSKLEGNRYV